MSAKDSHIADASEATNRSAISSDCWYDTRPRRVFTDFITAERPTLSQSDRTSVHKDPMEVSRNGGLQVHSILPPNGQNSNKFITQPRSQNGIEGPKKNESNGDNFTTNAISLTERENICCSPNKFHTTVVDIDDETPSLNVQNYGSSISRKCQLATQRKRIVHHQKSKTTINRIKFEKDDESDVNATSDFSVDEPSDVTAARSRILPSSNAPQQSSPIFPSVDGLSLNESSLSHLNYSLRTSGCNGISQINSGGPAVNQNSIYRPTSSNLSYKVQQLSLTTSPIGLPSLLFEDAKTPFSDDVTDWFTRGLSQSQLSVSKVPLPLIHQETDAEVHHLTFSWIIRDFRMLRDHAYMAALPHMQNFLESKEFGSFQAGNWYLMLFPNGETSAKDAANGAPAGGGVVVKVVSCNKKSLTAKAAFSILNSTGESMPEFRRSFDTFKWFQTNLYYNSLMICSDDEVEEFLDLLADDVLRIRCDLAVCTAIRDVPSGFRISANEIQNTSLERQLRDFALDPSNRDIDVYLTPLRKTTDLSRTDSEGGSGLSQTSGTIPSKTTAEVSNVSTNDHVSDRLTGEEHVIASNSSRDFLKTHSVHSHGILPKSSLSLTTPLVSKQKHTSVRALTRSSSPLGCVSIRASRFVLCARSHVFRAMLTSQFEEGRGDAICLSDMKPEILSNLIEYLHTDSLTSEDIHQRTDSVIDLLEASDKYDCYNLRMRCIQWLMENVTEKTAPLLLEVASRLKLKQLQVSCKAFGNCMKPLYDIIICLGDLS